MTQRVYDKLVVALREAGYTCREAAQELRITYQTFSEKIHGRSPWTLDEMYALLSLLDCSPTAMHVYFPRRGQP